MELITLSQAAPDDDVNRTCSGGSSATATAAAGDVASSGGAGAAAAAANGDAAAGLKSSPPKSPSASSAVVKRGNSGGSDEGGGGGVGGGSRVSLGTKFVVVTAPYGDQIKAGEGGGSDSDQRKAGRDQGQETGPVRREEAAAQLHEGKNVRPPPRVVRVCQRVER